MIRRFALLAGAFVALLAVTVTPAAASYATAPGPVRCHIYDGQVVAADAVVAKTKHLDSCGTDFTVVKSVSNPTPPPASAVQWTIAVENTGRVAIPALLVSDVLPAGNLYVTSTHIGGTNYDVVRGLWGIADLHPGATASLVITVIVNGASVTNCVEAAAFAPWLTLTPPSPSPTPSIVPSIPPATPSPVPAQHLGGPVQIGDRLRACATVTPNVPASTTGGTPVPTPAAISLDRVGLPNTGRAA